MKREGYHTWQAFLDLLFCNLLLYAGLFAMAFVLINISKENKKVDAKADFIITFSWPDDFDDDVDSYVEDPSGHLVCFQRREDGLMHLDRDDYGKSNDVVITPFGVVNYNQNREIVTIRGTIKGEYVVNAHLYRRNKADQPPVPVTVTIEKLNPFVKLITSKVIYLQNKGDEVTVCRFVLNEDGDVESINDLEKKFTRDPSRYGVPQQHPDYSRGNPDDNYNFEGE